MKKLIYLLFVVLYSSYNSQQSTMIINNFSAYDYRGEIDATGPNNCFPKVSNTTYPAPLYSPLLVAAGATVDVGTYNSNNAVSNWTVQTSAINPSSVRLYNNPTLQPSGIIATSTDWTFSKFTMYQSGTNTSLPNSGVNISNGNSPCSAAPSYYNNPNIPLEAEWFKIGGYTYLQIY